ncbi:heavy metal-binding domain-containing protein [Hymenobacter humi]|uniref:Heavy metal-binding domain-containing protein n=1 Tax=Hymenobacter humi TaxID=1411620 RepID=A0ABW2UG05_9BACT
MHPEVTSTKAGEKCPKCGMKLEHTDKVANVKTYAMKLVPTPDELTAGQPATLAFTPREVGNENAPVPLSVVHEKKIHLIIVSKDLGQFYHEHPEYTAEGNYQVKYTFPKGGQYVLFQDYTPDGAGHQPGPPAHHGKRHGLRASEVRKRRHAVGKGRLPGHPGV